MRRGRWFVIVGLVLCAGGLVWGIVSVTLMTPEDRASASGYGQFVLAVPGLLLAVWPYVQPLLRGRKGDVSVDELADRLAAAVRAQWTAAASDRGLLAPEPLPIRWRPCTDPVTGPVTAATTPRSLGESFPPLPGLEQVTTSQLREGTHRTLHRIYGGLASGRLIIAGGPGTGKSSAAILLLLDALNFRAHTPPEYRAEVPVPVLFTLAGWDPHTTPVNEWLATKLTELPVLTRPDTTQLLTARRIAVFLDGLDEIPEHHRPAVLHALAQQAAFRLVLLTRTTELTTATKHHILIGAIALELQPLTPKDAAKYLRHGLPEPPPPPWHQLLITLTTLSTAPITNALNTPLTITLLRDTYQPPPTPNSPIGSVDELLDTTHFPTPDHITNHLLDHAITTAYTPQPGQPPPPYTPHTAHRTLTLIAHHLRNHNTRDLAWWQITQWIPPTPRTLLTAGFTATFTGATAGLISELARLIPVLGPVPDTTFGLPFGLIFGLAFGLIAGSGAGIVAGFAAGLIGRRNQPSQLSRFRLDTVEWRTALVFGLAAGLMVGLAAGFVAGIVAGIVLGLAIGLVDGLGSRDPSDTGHPKDVWRSNLAYALTVGLVAGLAFGFAVGLAVGLMDAYLIGPAFAGLAFGLVFGLMGAFIVTEAWYMAISQIYLAIRYRTPLRLGRFLMDAHTRHLLRTVGPIYQFRHATLQDRLAPPTVGAAVDADG